MGDALKLLIGGSGLLYVILFGVGCVRNRNAATALV